MNRLLADRVTYWLRAVFLVTGTAVLGSTFKELAFLGGFIINTFFRATWMSEGADGEI